MDRTMTNQPSAETVIAFLNGEASLDGAWFGDNRPDYRGTFWWRRFLWILKPRADPRTAALVAALEKIAAYKGVTAETEQYRRQQDGRDAMQHKWLAERTLATFHASNPASAQVAGE